jgi:hypothetical protein
MSPLDLIPPAVRPWVAVLAVVMIAAAGAGAAWVAQDWRYGKALALQDVSAAKKAEGLAKTTAAQLKQEQDQRTALEGRLAASEQNHYKVLTDEKKARQLVLGRLATAELRLSVVLSAGLAPSGGAGVSPATGAGGLDHGGARAELDPAHAQRIVGITGDGDDGLTALAACQGWAREVLRDGKALPQ